MKIGVVGCGNVGGSFAEWLSLQGHQVFAVDLDLSVLESLKPRLKAESVVSNDIASVAKCDQVHICVPTEPDEIGNADLSAIESVVSDLEELQNLDYFRIQVISQRSTCPPNTADNFSQKFPSIDYVVHPSFLRKGNIFEDTKSPERIAIGGTRRGVEAVSKLYGNLECPKWLTESRTAVELLKYTENCLDSVLISFWNEITQVAIATGISPDSLIDILSVITDRAKFRGTARVPGKAFGLWCLPKDTQAFLQFSESLGTNCSVLAGAISTNEYAKQRWGVGEKSSTELFESVADKLEISEFGVRQVKEAYSSS